MSEADPEFRADPVFVGGVGRSGTHPIGRVIASSGIYFQIRTEVRFHADRGGLPDLHRGRITMDEFLESMRGYFWMRGKPVPQGLHKFTTVAEREVALEAFVAGFDEDPIAASRDLVSDLLDRPARAAGRPGWVELSTASVPEAPFLAQLFPRAHFINMVRDGRVVTAGAVRKLLNMTDDPVHALKQWERTIRKTQKAISQLEPDSILTVDFDKFVAGDRFAEMERIAAFLAIEDTKPMRRYVEKHIDDERANVGRWRERMSPADVRMIDRRYRRLFRRLSREGVDWLPQPEPRRLLRSGR